jgi:hypothetical protein
MTVEKLLFSDPKIVVSAHKPCFLPVERSYLSVQVGTAGNQRIQGFGAWDDQGENISSLNPFYCELTALYWFWRNARAPRVGLSHYRRYFCGSNAMGIIDAGDLMEMSNIDVILPVRRTYYFLSVQEQFSARFAPFYWDVLENAVADVDSGSIDTFRSLSRRHWCHLYNMFVMNWALFDEYMAWLFAVLGKAQSGLGIAEGRPSHQRILGHYAERLIDVWLSPRLETLTVRDHPVKYMDKQMDFRKAITLGRDYVSLRLKSSS